MGRAAQKREPLDQTLVARYAVVALMKAADGARRGMTRALHAFDLTLPQYNVLTILRHHEELPTFQIAARMVENTPGITRLVSTLESKRYIRRSQSKADRRQQLCSLTAEGRRVVDAAIPPFTAAQQRLIGDLNRSETLQMTALLKRVPPVTPAKL
jgi:MarR family transcriptional regulator, 2-MHQ and catechol-resistance regulon repressor